VLLTLPGTKLSLALIAGAAVVRLIIVDAARARLRIEIILLVLKNRGKIEINLRKYFGFAGSADDESRT